MDETRIFKALADPVRLSILKSIAEKRGCVKLIGKKIGKKQPNISQHLRVLKWAGIVEPKRQGREICYCLRDQRVLDIIRIARRLSYDRP